MHCGDLNGEDFQKGRVMCICGLPRWPCDEEFTCNARNTGSLPVSGRSPGEANGNPLQYSCLGNPMDRAAWRSTVLGVKVSEMT